MRASVLSLFCATALAVPSSLKHKHHQHHHHNEAREIVYTTVVQTEMHTVYWHPQETVEAQSYGAAPVYGQGPASYNAPASYENHPHHSSSDDVPAASKPTDTHTHTHTHTQVKGPETTDSTADDSSSYVAPKPETTHSTADNPSSYVAPVPHASATSEYTTAPSATGTAGSSGSLKGKNMVIFGDNLSDRGNGSYDHDVSGATSSKLYGFETWTNGKIAAEVLADKMKIPIKYDYAFGHNDGGANFGATVNNEFTQSNSNAPSCADQIKNYTSNGAYYDKATVGDSIHFLWCGNNDVLPWAMPTPNSVVKCNTSHIFTGSGADEGNANFATELAMLLAVQVQSLLDAGAKNIFVPNVYIRHLAPVVQKYFTGIYSAAGGVEQYGAVISDVNTKLEANLKTLSAKSGAKIVYYDAFKFLLDLYNDRASHGFTHGNTAPADICDDGADMDKLFACSPKTPAPKFIGDQFYWMQYLDLTETVHAMLAEDMLNAVNAAGF